MAPKNHFFYRRTTCQFLAISDIILGPKWADESLAPNIIFSLLDHLLGSVLETVLVSVLRSVLDLVLGCVLDAGAIFASPTMESRALSLHFQLGVILWRRPPFRDTLSVCVSGSCNVFLFVWEVF